MNLVEAAGYLGLQKDTVGRMARAGVIKGTRAANHRWVITVEDLDAYIESCRIQSGTLTHLHDIGD